MCCVLRGWRFIVGLIGLLPLLAWGQSPQSAWVAPLPLPLLVQDEARPTSPRVEHSGKTAALSFVLNKTAEVVAIGPGVILAAASSYNGSLSLLIYHGNNLFSYYLSMSNSIGPLANALVKRGDQVEAGAPLMSSLNAGDSLRLEVFRVDDDALRDQLLNSSWSDFEAFRVATPRYWSVDLPTLLGASIVEVASSINRLEFTISRMSSLSPEPVLALTFADKLESRKALFAAGYFSFSGTARGFFGSYTPNSLKSARSVFIGGGGQRVRVRVAESAADFDFERPPALGAALPHLSREETATVAGAIRTLPSQGLLGESENPVSGDQTRVARRTDRSDTNNGLLLTQVESHSAGGTGPVSAPPNVILSTGREVAAQGDAPGERRTSEDRTPFEEKRLAEERSERIRLASEAEAARRAQVELEQKLLVEAIERDRRIAEMDAERKKREELEQRLLTEIKERDRLAAEVRERDRIAAEARERDRLAAEVRERDRQQAAQPKPPPQQAQALQSTRRLALVIGNDAYQAVPKLLNVRADARAMAKQLEATGFKVTLQLDLSERAMKDALRTFRTSIEGGDEVVVFFAGHGVQLGAANYLLPVDIRGDSEEQVKDEAIPLQKILDDLGERKARFSLAIVDACRDNPFRSQGRAIGGRGLAPTAAASGQMVIFSAGTGQQALDRLGDKDENPNGLFTRIFLREMAKPGVSIDRVVRTVRNEVVQLAKGVGHDQVPALYDQTLGDFYFLR